MTSWIQITATAGLIISLIVIAITKASLSKEAFDDYGWRIPFFSFNHNGRGFVFDS
jgi:hypothetical protein